MASYNFILAKQIINSCKELKSASLGMHEDWCWTATTIWEDGEYLRELPDNADEIVVILYNEQYRKSRELGMSLLGDECEEKYRKILIAGIYSSHWATPVIELEFKDGTTKTFNCHNGVLGDELTKIENEMFWTLGALSRPVQESRSDIVVEDISKSN